MTRIPPSLAGRSAAEKSQLPILVICSIAVTCLVPISNSAQTAFIDFNVPGQYTNHFNPWEDTGGANGGVYSFAENSSAGVGASGAVSVFQNNDTTAVYNGGA